MGRKLYVGNLPYDVDDGDLKLAFAQCGQVQEASVIKDRESGRSRGFGFVTMADDDGARAALSTWSGKALGGRPLTVNEAQDRPRSAGRPKPRPEPEVRPRGFSPPPKEGRRERRERQGRDDYS